MQAGHLQAPLEESYSLLLRRPEQALWTHFRQEVHSKDIPLHVTLQLQTPQGYEGPGLGHCPDRSRRRVMRGEEWRLPGGRRSCGSTELRPWEKIEDWWGERAREMLSVWPPVVPSCLHAFAVRSSGKTRAAPDISADLKSLSRSWQTRGRPLSLPAPAQWVPVPPGGSGTMKA